MTSARDNPKAIFFDRDGVLNIDKGYVYKVEDFTWVDGAIDAIKFANSLGYLTFVVTNQSGIARGYYTIEDMRRLHDWMNAELEKYQAKIDKFYYCPYHDEGSVSAFVFQNHQDRKPNPGMLLRAIAEYGIDVSSSFLIGDKPSDIQAAKSARVEALMFEGGNLRDFLESWFVRRGIVTGSLHL